MQLSLPKRRRLFIMRHGEVAYFDGSGAPFRPDVVPLTPRGQQQAQAAGQALSDVSFDRAFVSPLLRTHETAELVLSGRSVPVDIDPQLKEIAPGKLRELPSDPSAFQAVFTDAFGAELKLEDQFLGGETFGSLIDRVNAWMDATLANATWTNALVVAHGGVNRAILSRALGSGIAGFGRMEQDPACINIVDVDERGRLLVRLINYSPTNPVKTGHRLTTMEELLVQYLGMDPDGF